jgi:hypothetical protein
MGLISEAIGFSILGILIIMNRHQADLNGLAGGSAVAMIGGISAIFVGFGFPCRRLSPLEVLRQTSGRAAGQASVDPFHFR